MPEQVKSVFRAPDRDGARQLADASTPVAARNGFVAIEEEWGEEGGKVTLTVTYERSAISTAPPQQRAAVPAGVGGPRIVVKRYEGSESDTAWNFQQDAVVAARDGYYPTAQVWQPGSWGCGAFLIALVLCVVLIGFLVFVYLLIVKPAGVLTVTYEFKGSGPAPLPAASTDGWQR